MKNESRTDIAALSAGVIAVAVSLFLGPGAWDIMSLLISVTMTLIILGYVLLHRRYWLQSLAMATAIGLALLPGAAFILEAYYSKEPLNYLLANYTLPCELISCGSQGETQTNVHVRYLAIVWLVVSAAIFIGDLLFQRSWSASRGNGGETPN